MPYTLYNPANDLERLHSALDLPWVEDAYHEACYEYLENTIEIEPVRTKWATDLLESGKVLIPEDINTADHCWNDDLKEEYWHKFVAHGACHWLAHPYLLLAEELFPAGNWQMLTTEAHTAVIDVDSGLIFDLTFAAYGITPDEIVELIQ